MKRLPLLLSAIAGMVDLTGFLSLGKVFTAHVTGNLVLAAADLSHGEQASTIQLLVVPTFAFAVGAAWLVARVSRRHDRSPLRALLWCQFLLLACIVVSRSTAGVTAVIAASAMGCQFALMRLELPGSPSTAVMTGNVTDSVLALLDAIASGRSSDRLKHSVQVLAGFTGGCVIAGFAVAWMKHGAWALPASLAGVALFCREREGSPPQ